MHGIVPHLWFDREAKEAAEFDVSRLPDSRVTNRTTITGTPPGDCDTQEEIDAYSEKLSAAPESEQCGWLKDKYGVSWQIVPAVLEDMPVKGSKEQKQRATREFLKMKQFIIADLEKTYRGDRVY